MNENILELLHSLKIEIDSLKQRIVILENDKPEKLLEKDYQAHLQKLFNGNSHLKNKYGVTDITTDNTHIEIKNYSHYKNCLGQLIAYNLGNPKQHLIAAFFGDTVFKERATDLMHYNKIDVWDITIINNELVIEKYPYIPKQTLDFIEKHLQKTDNPRDIIKLSELQKYTTNTDFIPTIGHKLVNTENFFLNDVLLKNFEVGEIKDFVKLKDIKGILKRNNITEDNIVTIIEDTFEGVKFKERSSIFNQSLHRVFLGLNIIPNLQDNTIVDFLKQNFKIGEAKDFIKLKDVKEVFKANNVNFESDVTLKFLIEDTFEGVKFRETVKQNNNKFYNIFLKLNLV